ncbi:peptidase [Dacryopinax primogenitus]|uniref:Peptide hydrolase n=1 Tax=Dacryopinax primogenitus (strain DJM 731) TaxID=1858805 RepID=M5FNK6_DACPD|nr:peptidase [Dacryopinax primogenitus]EJT97610.1 peptidase [Dacryopinax primogenitus]
MRVFLSSLLCAAILGYRAGAVVIDDFSMTSQKFLSSGVPEGFTLDLNEERLVQFAEDDKPVWITEREKIRAKALGRKFFDITHTPWFKRPPTSLAPSLAYPAPDKQNLVNTVIANLTVDGMISNLQKFTSFRTRYYRSETGKESQKWLLNRISEITAEYASPSLTYLITLTEFTHPWGQNSIILKIKGASEAAAVENGTVVIGAHQDSANTIPFLPAPGADDDGSGTVTILETYRGLLASNYTPVQDVEFHWYSAEEGGLLGSQAVAQSYAQENVNIHSMVQFDMTAWVKRGTREEIGIVTDYVDADLTEFIRTLVNTYCGIPYVDTQCGYACSDHASWGKAGYRSAFGIESTFDNSDKNIHSTNDRMDISDEFSFDHMLEFSKLAVGYIIETAGWSKL